MAGSCYIRAAHVNRLFLREPLVHFLGIGAALFVLSGLFGRLSADNRNRIHVSAAKLQQLRDVWTARWGSSPDATQMQGLVDDFVREEVLYREAMASGLDRDDAIVRRHLAQKVEFLAQGVIAASEPSDADLRE